jgi:hypothetical protein
VQLLSRSITTTSVALHSPACVLKLTLLTVHNRQQKGFRIPSKSTTDLEYYNIEGIE